MGTMKMKAREPITKLVHMQQEPTLPVDFKPAVAIPKKRKTHEMIVGANSPAPMPKKADSGIWQTVP